MSEWKQREQWVCDIRDSGIVVDITITRVRGEESAVWWIDGFDRRSMLSAEPLHGAALNPKKAKKEALREASALFGRMLAARGGA